LPLGRHRLIIPKIETKLQTPRSASEFNFAEHEQAVFSPAHGLAGFLQEKLRWYIKSQEDAPIWEQRQATCQTDFRVGTLE